MKTPDPQPAPSERACRRLHRLVLFGLIALGLLMVLGSNAVTVAAQAGDAYSLIAAVNNLRAANGLPPYEINNILMLIAQAHSDYQAAIGTVTHTGSRGTRPRDRAAAAGYGGGGQYFISENIAGGRDLSPQEAVSWWTGDAPHLNTMLGANYREVGGGASTSGGRVYYTIDAAYIVGGSVEAPPPPGPGPTGPTAPSFSPFLESTPQEDGSIVHVVQPGQTLIGIANAYDIPLADLLELNGMNENSFIYVDDEVLVRGPNTPTPTASPTHTSTPLPPTPRPTRTPRPSTATPVVPVHETTGGSPTPTAAGLGAAAVAQMLAETDRETLVLGVIAGAFVFLVAPLAVALIRRK